MTSTEFVHYLNRRRGVKSLWNEWDPLDLAKGGRNLREDYEQFVGPMLHLMDSGAGSREIAAYICWSMASRFGATVTLPEADVFAASVLAWHRADYGTGEAMAQHNPDQRKMGNDGR
jgi:hypothetical protein